MGKYRTDRTTHISPKDYKYIENISLRETFVENYAIKLRNRLHAEKDLGKVFTAVYGREWYQRPYKELYKLAKLVPEDKNYHSHATIYINPGYLEDMFKYKDKYEQSYLVRYVKKIMGERRGENFLKKVSHDNYNSACGVALSVARADLIVKKYAKDLRKEYLGELKDGNGQVSDAIVYNAGKIISRDTKYLLGDFEEELIRLSVEGAMCDTEEKALYDIIRVRTDSIARKLYNYSYAYESHKDTLLRLIAKDVHEIQRTVSFMKDLRQLGLVSKYADDDRFNSYTKVDGKLIKVVHQIAKKGDKVESSDLDVVSQLSKTIREDSVLRKTYTPQLIRKEESNAE